ncbi:MAG: hypothetical protein AAF236_07240 [Verrucomicrobiota bacterium]
MRTNFRKVAAVLLVCAALLGADGQAEELILSDDFEREESQEISDEVGNGWETNSANRAAGEKQADLRDGALHVRMHEKADHSVSVTHAVEFRNGSVELRFRLDHEKDSLRINFADLDYKKVHAGHLFQAIISPKGIDLVDLAGGIMSLETRQAKLDGSLSKEAARAIVKKATTSIEAPVEVGVWHQIKLSISDETLVVELEGTTLGEASFPSIAHPTKRKLRLGIQREAVIDDVKVFRGAD